MILKRMNKKEKTAFFAVIIISVIIIFFPYFFLGRKYLISYDTLNLHIPFYTELRNKISSGDSLFWSHNYLFGSSYLIGKSFFLTTDPFSYLIILFPFLEIVDFLFVLQIIKSIVSYVSMYLFLDEFNFSFRTKIAGAIAYTFSSWFFLLYGMPTFVSFAAILPLFFLSIERYLKNNKLFGAFIFSFLLICINFYYFYSLSFFLVVYWIARYLFYYNNKFDIKHFLKKTLLLIFIYSLGVGLSGPIILPSIYYMLHNPRVMSSSITSIFWEPIKIYVDMLSKFLSSSIYVNKPYPTVLQSNYYRLDQIGLFTSACTCLLLPQFFAISNKKNKIVGFIIFIVYFLLLITQFGCSLMHGFSEPSFRWTLLLTFVLCFLLVYLLNNLEKINKKLLVGSLLVYVMFLLALIVYFDMLHQAHFQLFVILLSIVLMIIYSTLIVRNKKNLISVCIIFEVVLLGFVSNYVWKDKYQTNYQYEFVPDDYFDKFNDSNEYYRVWVSNENIDIDYQKDFNYNNNLLFNYKGLYSYDSVYQSSMNGLTKAYEEYFHWYYFTTDGILTTTSTKYYIAKSEFEIPNSNIEFVEKIGNSDYNLYLNKDYRRFGYTNNNIYPFGDWFSDDIYNKDLLIKDYLIVKENDIEQNDLINLDNNETHYLTNVNYTGNTIDGDITTTTKELLFISIPYDRGWKIKCDDTEMSIMQINGGFMAVLIPEGTHHIHMEYVPYGFNIGIVVSIVSLACFILISKKKINIK